MITVPPGKPLLAYHGLGYVGLTGAVHFTQAGVHVMGYDPDLGVVNAINSGQPRAGDFLSYLGGVDYRQRMWATADFDEVKHLPVHILAVPSERDDEPWMQLVFGVLKHLFGAVAPGTLIIVESTLQPGAIDNFLAQYPNCAEAIETGKILLAVCPRRDWFADPSKNLSTLYRIVGGVNDASTREAADVLSLVTPRDKLLLTDYRTAELTKALENSLFHLPIMLCHELAATYPTLDVAKAVELACTHWRFASFGSLHLNFGSGGRCVPLASRYLSVGNPRRHPPMLLERATAVDKAFPALVADVAYRRGKELAKDRAPRCLVMGIAYRPGFRDAGFSPGLRVANALVGFGADTWIHDPVFSPSELKKLAPTSVAVAPNVHPDEFDVLLLATPHPDYLTMPEAWLRGPIVIDARGIWKSYAAKFAAYVQVGTPDWSKS